MFKSRNAKIAPSSSDIDTEETVGTSSLETMRVMSLATLFKLYGGQRHPHLETYEKFKGSGELLLLRYVPHGATVIYISHEWVGSEHPDPRHGSGRVERASHKRVHLVRLVFTASTITRNISRGSCEAESRLGSGS